MSSEEAVIPSGECLCVGNCVGSECVKRRSTALVSLRRPHEARQLLEQALRREEHASLVDELRSVLQVIAESNSSSDRQTLSQSESTNSDPAVATGVKEQQIATHRAMEEEKARDCCKPKPSPEKRRRVEETSRNCATEEAQGRNYFKPRPSSAKHHRVEDISHASLLEEIFICVLCSKLLYEPVTTPCGHTFCRTCLSRAIDFTDSCPLCRTVLHLEDPSAIPISNILRNAIQLCFGDEYAKRQSEVEDDAPSAENAMNRLPLFPLNAVVFPMQRFPMHIFEPRYRLMLRRIMQGSRKFGLIALKRTQGGSLELHEVGCVLEVTKTDQFPDGRSLIETKARERFRLHGWTEVDGYLVGRTEVYEDTEDTDTDEVREVEAKVRGIVDKLMERGSRVPTIQHALQRAGDVPTKTQGPGALGMWLAGMLVSDDNERQNMLEMCNSAKRLKAMMAILERFRDSASATATANGDNGRECCVQ